MSAIFHSPSKKTPLNFREVVSEIISYIQSEKNQPYKIIVGADSAAENWTQFVTAVSVLKVGKGGRYFWTKSEIVFCPTLQDRIYKETMAAITMAQELKSRFREFAGEDFLWDEKVIVHIDVGKNGPTRDLIDAVVGMAKGYGLEAVIKPEAFCSFVVADRHTHSIENRPPH